MRKFFWTAVLIAVTGCVSVSERPGDSMQAPQTVQHFNVPANGKRQIHFLLFLPAGYKQATNKTWPLMLFLHGAGERGTNIWKVATHGPPKWVMEHPDFPFILVSPQCQEGRTWSGDILLALLEQVSKKYAVDRSRIYVTGLSMGGY